MATRVTELLHCDHPIQLAPMGSVSVTAALPLAVAAAGGHGMYSVLGLPPQVLAPVLDALAAQTRAFGFNFFPGVMDRGSLELAAERAPYVDFFLADADRALVEIVHAGGGVCGWQVEVDAQQAVAREREAVDVDGVDARAVEAAAGALVVRERQAGRGVVVGGLATWRW